MEKSEDANLPRNDSDEDFMRSVPSIQSPLEHVELSNVFSLEQPLSEHDSSGNLNNGGPKNIREDLKVPSPETRFYSNRVYIAADDCDESMPQDSEITPMKRHRDSSVEPHTTPSYKNQTTPEDACQSSVKPAMKYYCEICDKAFKKKNNHKSHMRKHVSYMSTFIFILSQSE